MNRKYFLSVIAIFKNESWNLNEWISHYVNEGVEHFYLINNNSSDDFMKPLQSWLTQGMVTLIEDDSKWAQKRLYDKHFLDKSNESEWFIIADLDEFIYARNGFKTVAEYLKTRGERIGMIKIPWKMFGSGGHLKQPKSVLSSFVKRSEYTGKRKKEWMRSKKIIHCKSIVRGNAVKKFNIHYSKTKFWYFTENAKGKKIFTPPWGKSDTTISETLLSQSFLQLNHYNIQSWEWFSKTKVGRGSASTSTHEHIRNKEYFSRNDLMSDDIIDQELALKNY
ncbi:MAG: glycosyltransferase family 2 protein [Cyclobacteriaceae bacterium]